MTSDTNSPVAPSPGRWDRWGRYYQRFAVICLNTTIMLMLALAGMSIFLNSSPSPQEIRDNTSHDLITIGVNNPYSTVMNRNAHYLSEPDAFSQLAREFDRFAREGHWQVHPWGGLTMRPLTGQYLNIDRDGYRITPPPDPAYAGKRPLRIWGFGGSTLFGQALPDEYTLAAQLQVELQSRLPERQVQVLNFGVPWYFSSQEVVLFMEHLRRLPAPDIAFFLDGLNDYYALKGPNQTPFPARLAAVWENEIAQQIDPGSKPWVTLNYSFPPYRLASELGLVEVNPPVLFSYQYALNENPHIADRIDYGIQQYVKNQVMGETVGRAFDVSTYFFFQPLPSFQGDADYLSFAEGVLTGDKVSTFFDLTDAFAAAEPHYHLLADPTHYSDYAIQILAERIADILLDAESF